MDDVVVGLLSGIGGGGAVAAAAWAALRWYLQRDFYTRAEGASVYGRLIKLEEAHREVSDLARGALSAAERTDRLLREDLIPELRRSNVVTQDLRVQASELRVATEHTLSFIRDLQKRVAGVEQR